MSLAYADEAIHLREVTALSDRDIARATGSGVSTVSAWLRRERAPRGRRAERLVELSAIADRLTAVLGAERVPVWLNKPIPALEHRKPLDVIAAGRLRAGLARGRRARVADFRLARCQQRIPAVPTTGDWYRHVRAGAPPMPGHPAPGGRWQRGEQLAALYVAQDPATVWAEWYRALAELGEPPDARLPRDLWRFSLHLPRVADLSQPRRCERSACRTSSPSGRSGPRSRKPARCSQPTVSTASCSAPAHGQPVVRVRVRDRSGLRRRQPSKAPSGSSRARAAARNAHLSAPHGSPTPRRERNPLTPDSMTSEKEKRMSAITAALSQIDGVAAEGDLVPEPAAALELETAGEPILLPDGKRIYPPCLHGQPIDELALALLDMHDPAQSSFLRLIGPPGAGKSQIARAIAYRLWANRGRDVADRHGAPFYGFVELQPGPSSDEFFFRYDYVPVAGAGGQVELVDSAFVQAMREGWVVMIDEVNTARDVALLSINATLDGRLSLYLAATGETVVAQPGFAVLLAYNPGLVGATDIPDAWHSRFPATLEVTSNWAALAQLGAPQSLVAEAMRLDRQRIAGEDGLSWTPQFRDIESLWRMSERVGERAALAFFASNLHEQVSAGKIQDAEAAAACRMLDQAGYGRLRVVGATSGLPNLHGYPRAVTS